jgi:hypothetical protein
MTILELASIAASAKLRLDGLSMMNTPTDYAARVAMDARYQIAEDAYAKADADYRSAIAGMIADELRALSRLPE